MNISLNRFPFLITWPAYLYLQLIGRTNRLQCREEDCREVLRREKHPHIFCFWHSQLLLPIYHFHTFDLSVIISQSADGEVISQAIHLWGIETTRGSASKRGSEGLLGLVHALKQGRNAIVTPDGPRGPREKVQMGVVQLAKLSGVPITPVAFSHSRQIRLNSWDRFIVPLPFGTLYMHRGNEIHVPKDAEKPMLENLRDRLQNELDRITQFP